MDGERVGEGWFPDPWGEAPLRWWDGSDWTGYVSERVAPGGNLSHLLGGNGRVAVVDVETTGLYRTDRVLEVAVVVIDALGAVVGEFETLVNPMRDVGPVWVHGVSASMLSDAPVFSEVLPQLAALLDGAVLCAHNLPFDVRMLNAEFDRAGVAVDWGTGVDTLALTGSKLDVACETAGVVLEGAHSAIGDARGAAGLLLAHASAVTAPLAPVRVGPYVATPVRVLTREGLAAAEEEAVAASAAPFMTSVVPVSAAGPSAESVTAYTDLLGRALADLRLTDEERAELAALAAELGLSDAQVAAAHSSYVSALLESAVADRVVTGEEYEVLLRVAALLGVDTEVVDARTEGLRSELVLVELTEGMSVCFTGEAFGPGEPHQREPLLRSDLEMLCVRVGLDPVRTVTAKNCNLLVAADPASRSGKAAKARRWGIPVVSVVDFLLVLDDGGPLVGSVLSSPGVALVCVRCGGSWLAQRRTASSLCGECRPAAPRRSAGTAAASLPPPTPSAGSVTSPVTEELECDECGRTWERVRTRGRKPRSCPDCS